MSIDFAERRVPLKLFVGLDVAGLETCTIPGILKPFTGQI